MFFFKLNDQAPEIQQMYSLNMPVSKIRTKVRSEYEKHRFVNQVGTIDVLLFQAHSEFQVGLSISLSRSLIPRCKIVGEEEEA
jgi:hypothetical protein